MSLSRLILRPSRESAIGHLAGLLLGLAGLAGLAGAVGIQGCGKESGNTAGAAPRSGGGGGGRGQAVFPVEVVPVKSRAGRVLGHRRGLGRGVRGRPGHRPRAGCGREGPLSRGRRGSSEGEVLVEIEPERYRLEVDAARATVAKAKAAHAEAEAGLARRDGRQRANPGLIPGEEVETWRTRVVSAAGRSRGSGSRARARRAESARRRRAGAVPRHDPDAQRADGPVRAAGNAARDARPPRAAALALPGSGRRCRPPHAAHDGPLPGAERRGASARAKITHVAEAADPASRMVAVTAEVGDAGRPAPRPGAFAEVDGADRERQGCAGDPPDRRAAERARLPRLRGRGRDGPGARADARPAHRRRPRRGAKRGRGRREPGRARRRGAARRGRRCAWSRRAPTPRRRPPHLRARSAPAGGAARNRIMNLTEVCIRKPVLAWMLMAATVVFGWCRRVAHRHQPVPRRRLPDHQRQRDLGGRRARR